jgi:hypothetical protein
VPGLVAALAWLLVFRRVTLIVVAGAAATTVALTPVIDERVVVEELTAGRVAPAIAAAVLAGVAIALIRTRDGESVGLGLAIGSSAVAMWTAVPETSAVLVAGALAGGLALGAVVGLRTSWWGLAAAAAVVALSGAAGFAPTDVRAAGAAASLGLLVWWPVGRLVRRFVPIPVEVPAGAWLLGAHLMLAALAARWVGAADGATWARLAAVAVIGTVTAAVTGPRATMEP